MRREPHLNHKIGPTELTNVEKFLNAPNAISEKEQKESEKAAEYAMTGIALRLLADIGEAVGRTAPDVAHTVRDGKSLFTPYVLPPTDEQITEVVRSLDEKEVMLRCLEVIDCAFSVAAIEAGRKAYNNSENWEYNTWTCKHTWANGEYDDESQDNATATEYEDVATR